MEHRYICSKSDSCSYLDSKFALAWGLVRRPYTKEISRGISLLEEILEEDPERSRECYYYMGAAFLKIKDYVKADQVVSKLLDQEPNNSQALALKKCIKDSIGRGTNVKFIYITDGMIGLASVGGIAAVGFGLLLRLTKKQE